MPPKPLSLKPDLAEANRRWQAFYAGDLIDRPVVSVTAPADDHHEIPQRVGYHDKVFGDLDDVIDRAIAAAQATYWGGEAVPTFFPSFGCDEIAVFCGAGFRWSDDSPDTNWSTPFVQDWDDALPLRIQENHPLWQRLLTLCRRASERMAGTMLLTPLDLHTNLDLLAAVRGPQRLCLDLADRPKVIDEAMASARAVFRQMWRAVAKAGRMDELGYCHAFYAMDGAAVLQCDFSFMIGPEMFRRWVLPALEEEADIVRHAMYHWDGPGALVHTADLVASKGLLALSYVPGTGRGGHINYLPLLKRVQAGGKAIQVWGTPKEVQAMHRELAPNLVCYSTRTETRAEAEALLEWFVKHT